MGIIMDYKSLILKKAFSKDNKKIGVIYSLEGSQRKVVLSERLHAIIYVRKIFKKDAKIPLPVDSIISIEDEKVIFDIKKFDFNLKVRDYYFQRKTIKDPRKEKLESELDDSFDRGFSYKRFKEKF